MTILRLSDGVAGFGLEFLFDTYYVCLLLGKWIRLNCELRYSVFD